MRPPIDLLLAVLALLMSAPAWAVEFRSIATPAVVLYDAPSVQARKLYLVDRYYPVEIIVSLGEWMKVRDSRGELAWVEAKNLAPMRMLLVTTAKVEVHAAPDAASAVIFRADKDVVLEWLDAGSSGWAKVRHRDGLTGFVQSSQVWGL